MQHNKVLVIGLDGATFDLMLPWIDEGHLPHLGRLVQEGSWSRLRSTVPPITPCAWSSFMTGKNPGKHGLFDFVEPHPRGEGFRFTNASSRHGESLWGCLSRHDRRVGVVNVPMTYPPEPVNGYLLSGLDTPHEQSEYSHPGDLRDQLRNASIPYRVDLRHLGDMRTDSKRDRRIGDLLEMESIRTDALHFLSKKYPSDFTMVVYIATDQVQHHFWHYMDPEHDKYDPAGAEQYGHVIRDTYIHIDGLIGSLLSQVDDDTVVVVMSDHGFGPTSNVRLRLNQALAEENLLKFAREPGHGRFLRVLGGIADRILRSTLSPTLKARLAAMLPKLRDWFEQVDEAKLDWNETLAYVNEAYRASPAIWLNRDGDASQGKAIENVLNSVEEMLAGLKDPQTGRPVIREMIRTRDLYWGPYVANAPDLLPSWWTDGFLLDQSQPGASAEQIVERSLQPIVGGVEFAGSHRMDGVLIMHGGPVQQGNEFHGAEITDVAPTVLHLMGLPIPDDMDGTVLRSALDENFLDQFPPQYEQVSEPTNEPTDNQDNELSPDDERAIAERLRALGYIN